MKKKTIGRLAAVSLAAMTAASSLVITASAIETLSPGTKIYKVSITTSTQVGDTTTTGTTDVKYYITKSAADSAVSSATGASRVNMETLDISALGYGVTVYTNNSIITTTKTDGYTAYLTPTSGGSSTGTSTGSGAAYVRYPYQSTSNLTYYSSVRDRWYPNLASLYADGGQSYTRTGVSEFSSTNCYFDTRDGKYYNHDDTGRVLITYQSNENDYYYNGYYDSTWSTYDVYRVNGRYYPTLSEAESAARAGGYTISKIRDYSAPQTNYFSYTTGYYYNTYAAALSASGNNSSNVRTFSYYSGNYYDGYYYNGNYLDPSSYYWWVMYGNGKKDDDSSSNTNDTTTAAIGNRKGWTSVAKYLGNLKSGSSVKVSMNTETTVPSSVTSAIKGKNVTVKFVLKNGTVFTINGKDISSAKDIDIATTYNTDNVPSKLVKAAYKKNKAVSTAQISIDSDSFGASADITVKFATKRAGYTAKLYRYNPSKQTLSLVDSAKIQDTGKCTFGEVTKGGDFVIVIC